MKKLLFVMSNLQNGGAERSLVNLLQLIDYSRYEVDLLLFQECGMFLKQVPKQVRFVRDGAEKLHALYQENAKDTLLNPRYFIVNIKRLWGTQKSKNKMGKALCAKQYRWKNYYCREIPKLSTHYDTAVAYLHGEQFYYVVDKVNATQKIGWVHNEYSKSGLSAKLDLPYFEKMDHIVTISEKCADDLQKQFPTQKAKISVLPNLTSAESVRVLADEFFPSEYTKGQCIIVSIGRLHPQKGFDLAIRSAKMLKQRGLKFTWFILGSGDLQNELENMRMQEDVADCLHFIGSRANPYPYLKNADVVVQSSRYEGKSIVLDEAKILMKPIVATNYATVRDQLSDKEGLVVMMEPEAIAAGIIEMLNNGQRYADYLASQEYGNTHELVGYYRLFD